MEIIKVALKAIRRDVGFFVVLHLLTVGMSLMPAFMIVLAGGPSFMLWLLPLFAFLLPSTLHLFVAADVVQGKRLREARLGR